MRWASLLGPGVQRIFEGGSPWPAGVAQQTKSLPGEFVECGVNRGGMARVVMEYVNFSSMNKKFYLLDTYCGIPDDMKHASAPLAFDY